MKKSLAVLSTAGAMLAAPFVALAQTKPSLSITCASTQSGDLNGVVCTIYRLINVVIPVLILGAVAWFIWGIVQFITAHDGEEKGAARGMMVHGIIAFAVILGMWGIVFILLRTFSVGTGAANVEYSFPTF